MSDLKLRTEWCKPQVATAAAQAEERSTEAERPTNSVWISCAFALFLVAATFAAYHPAWHGGFLWDDDAYVSRNELLTAPDGLRRIWFSTDSPSQYFPLVYTTFRIERALWGLDTTGYHIVNISLHVANALLLWLLLSRLRLRGAAIAAAIFALHPVQVESVAWITERKNVLMGLFFLLSLIAWNAFLDAKSWRRAILYSAALVCYALALFSKSTACTLPAALLLIVWLRRKSINLRALLAVLPFLLFGAAMAVVTIVWEQHHQGTETLAPLAPLDRLLIASRAIWFYLAKLVWPANLAFSYPKWHIDAHDPLGYLWLGAAVAAFALVIALRRWIGRGPEVAAIYFVATLAPLLGFVMLFTFRYSYVADHYQYLACIGPIALVAAGGAWAGERSRAFRYTGFVVSAAVLAALATLTWRQSAAYSDLETLWRATIARNPDSLLAHLNLGELLMRSGRGREATQEFTRAVLLAPDSAEAQYNLAGALLQNGDLAGALEHSENAVALWPDNAEVQTLRAFALATAGRNDEAVEHYRVAAKLKPNDASAQRDLGTALLRAGRIDDAIRTLTPLAQRGDDPVARAALANALLAKGDFAAAISELSKQLEASPGDVTTETTLAWVLATAPDAALRDGGRALGLAQAAVSATNGREPRTVRALAAAFAEEGQFDEAIHAAEVAIAMCDELGERDLAAALRQELAAYQAGTPYRKPSR